MRSGFIQWGFSFHLFSNFNVLSHRVASPSESCRKNLCCLLHGGVRHSFCDCVSFKPVWFNTAGGSHNGRLGIAKRNPERSLNKYIDWRGGLCSAAFFCLHKRRNRYGDCKAALQKDRDVIMYRILQSFKHGETTPEVTNQIGYELAIDTRKATANYGLYPWR